MKILLKLNEYNILKNQIIQSKTKFENSRKILDDINADIEEKTKKLSNKLTQYNTIKKGVYPNIDRYEHELVNECVQLSDEIGTQYNDSDTAIDEATRLITSVKDIESQLEEILKAINTNNEKVNNAIKSDAPKLEDIKLL